MKIFLFIKSLKNNLKVQKDKKVSTGIPENTLLWRFGRLYGFRIFELTRILIPIGDEFVVDHLKMHAVSTFLVVFAVVVLVVVVRVP